jgi:hypothetical protein
MRPCLDCGAPAAAPRCDEHTIDPKRPAAERGYDAAWRRLSTRARRLQQFCELCGSTHDLQADHLPIAWQRKAAGKAVRLQDIRVLCRTCNIAAGAARGRSATRGVDPPASQGDPGAKGAANYTPEPG